MFVLAVSLASVPLAAQDPVSSYKVGERIEYKDRGAYDPATSSYPVVWKPGTVVRVDAAYNQLLIRWDKDPRYPSGYEQAYSITDVRHAGAARAATPAPAAAAPAAPRAPAAAPPPPNVAPGRGLMSKAEILGYMRTRGYVNGTARHDVQVCRDLIAEIKRRGVQERLEPGKDDLSPIYDNGCAMSDTDVDAATRVNLGVPTTTDWLAGTWAMYVVGGTVDYAGGDGWIYRKNESLGKLGFLTIDRGGTYTWKVDPSDPPAKYVKGTWRPATAAEMGVQGGAGIVLQKAAEGADWIVYKYMDPSRAEDRIDVQHLQSRGAYRRIGWRR